ncbi:MAG: FAD-binding protein, partial [Caulobacterales bacterium]|nr:FAD-binding protein [Caulobacterales bacterium]
DGDATVLEMTGFSSVIDYDPAELVLTVGAGARLSEVEALVASHGQALAFDPFDHGPLFNESAGASTIGGIIAAGVAGPRRLTKGAARDHLLGFEAVSGRGERFIGGAKVVKNVTGFDLPKLMAGSWGRLAALTQVTLKVLPRPKAQHTKLVTGLDVRDALRLIAKVMRSTAEVGAAAHIPCAAAYGGRPVTALLLEGFPSSVEARCEMLDDLLEGCAQAATIEGEACAGFWREIATAKPLGHERPLWRIVAPASRAPAIAQSLGLRPEDQLFDWAGGLLWIAYDGDPARVRAAAEAADGQAMLVRAPAPMRPSTPAFHPPAPGVASLQSRVRHAFDPLCVFETGRF